MYAFMFQFNFNKKKIVLFLFSNILGLICAISRSDEYLFRQIYQIKYNFIIITTKYQAKVNSQGQISFAILHIK